MKKTFVILFLSLVTIMTVYPLTKKNKESNFSIATFNLRMDTPNDGINAWPNRKEMVKGLIKFHNLEIIGIQEGFKHQIDDILTLGDFAYVGGGRDDGKDAGEHSAIIYKKERFELLDHGDFWYSETPNIPGKGWDATCCNRICSWAKFKDRSSGKKFFVFNSHFDHQGKVARKNSAILLLKMIAQISGNTPVFATGDFNATPEDEPIQIIYNSKKLNDAYLVTKTPPYGTVGTFNSFKTDSSMKSRIDYIWVSPGISVEKYGVINDMQYGRFPSDHFPVVIQAKL